MKFIRSGGSSRPEQNQLIIFCSQCVGRIIQRVSHKQNVRKQGIHECFVSCIQNAKDVTKTHRNDIRKRVKTKKFGQSSNVTLTCYHPTCMNQRLNSDGSGYASTNLPFAGATLTWFHLFMLCSTIQLDWVPVLMLL